MPRDVHLIFTMMFDISDVLEDSCVYILSFLWLQRSASSKTVYPLRIGVVGDIGQTVNSSQTRNHLSANKPQVIINVGDLTYADNFLPWDVPVSHAQLTHQRRWDSFIQLWTSLFSKVPQIHALGNHEMEMGNINAELNPSSTTFQYPSNYPFQAYSARFPAPVRSWCLSERLVPVSKIEVLIYKGCSRLLNI